MHIRKYKHFENSGGGKSFNLDWNKHSAHKKIEALLVNKNLSWPRYLLI